MCTQQHRIEQTLTSPDAVADGSLEAAKAIATGCFAEGGDNVSEKELARAASFIHWQGKDMVTNKELGNMVADLCNKAAQVPAHAHHIHV